MNEWSRFIQERIDAKGLRNADAARRSHGKLSSQRLSQILRDPQEKLTKIPEEKTVQGVALALGVSEAECWLKIGVAMGLPLGKAVLTADARNLTDDQLVEELRRRLEAAAQEGDDAGTVTPLRTAARKRSPRGNGADHPKGRER